MNQPIIYTAVAKGSEIVVFNANNSIRLYTLSLGSNFKVTAGPYCNGDTMTVYVQTSDGSQYLKTFSLRTGTAQSTVTV
jgi:hypothetical protein